MFLFTLSSAFINDISCTLGYHLPCLYCKPLKSVTLYLPWSTQNRLFKCQKQNTHIISILHDVFPGYFPALFWGFCSNKIFDVIYAFISELTILLGLWQRVCWKMCWLPSEMKQNHHESPNLPVVQGKNNSNQLRLTVTANHIIVVLIMDNSSWYFDCK